MWEKDKMPVRSISSFSYNVFKMLVPKDLLKPKIVYPFPIIARKKIRLNRVSNSNHEVMSQIYSQLNHPGGLYWTGLIRISHANADSSSDNVFYIYTQPDLDLNISFNKNNETNPNLC